MKTRQTNSEAKHQATCSIRSRICKSIPGEFHSSISVGAGTHQETISRRPEQVCLPFDPRLEWPGEGSLFEFNLNKCWGQNVGTIRVTPGPLFLKKVEGSLSK